MVIRTPAVRRTQRITMVTSDGVNAPVTKDYETSCIHGFATIISVNYM